MLHHECNFGYFGHFWPFLAIFGPLLSYLAILHPKGNIHLSKARGNQPKSAKNGQRRKRAPGARHRFSHFGGHSSVFWVETKNQKKSKNAHFANMRCTGYGALRSTAAITSGYHQGTQKSFEWHVCAIL